MTLKECYEQFDGDYSAVMMQLGSEKLVDKFLRKYPSDNTMEILKAAVEAGDIEGSFKAAHTLKGVTANLALKRLNQATCDLTEQLRPQTEVADMELMKKVTESYELVIRSIEQYIAEQG